MKPALQQGGIDFETNESFDRKAEPTCVRYYPYLEYDFRSKFTSKQLFSFL